MSRLDELEEKINKLEEKRMAYLEIDNNSYARKIKKQIEMLEIEMEAIVINDIKKELRIYKEVVKQYPSILIEIKDKLAESGIYKLCA